ncbi:MAG: 3-phosphoshikimate 1-carboxyvinyltransferase, partial [Planctomycetota bacterium]
ILRLLGAAVSQEEGGMRVRGGRLRGLTLDLSLSPDLAPVLGVLGALAEGETAVTGAPHLAYKESDRIETTTGLIRALGGEAEAQPDGFRVRGGRPLTGTRVSARGDHRIAMAAAVAGVCLPGVTVEGAETVAKSYPGFFEDLDALTS